MNWLALGLAAAALAAAMSLVMAAAFLVQQRSGNSGWVDTIWSFGTGAVGIAAALYPAAETGWPSARQVAVALLVSIWSLRLGLHIALRSRGVADDPRYAAMIRAWGKHAPRRMFLFLQAQAVAAVPLTFAIFVAAHRPAPLGALDGFAAALLLVAVAGESAADAQLARFRADPHNKARICDAGLWRLSRHPNYFFEWLGWLAYPLLAADVSGAYPAGWIAWLAPLEMYWLLVHVSGIPPLEQHMLQSRGDAFPAYRARTAAFFPLPPRG